MERSKYAVQCLRSIFLCAMCVSCLIINITGCRRKSNPAEPQPGPAATATLTSTPVQPATATNTPAITATRTITITATPTPSPAITPSESPTCTMDGDTATNTATQECSSTCTETAAVSLTFSPTSTITQTRTVILTATATMTPTPRLMDHFTIKAAGGGMIGDQIAGVPFNISITAWADAGETMIAQGMDGYQTLLSSSTDYFPNEYCLTPRITQLFSKGFLSVTVVMYRASVNNETIGASFGSSSGTSNGFKIQSGPATQLMVLVQGMTYKPGLLQDGEPGYMGYSGNPVPEPIGGSFSLQTILVDSNYNRVTITPVIYPRITSPVDTLASIDGVLCSSGVYVTMTVGLFTTSNAALGGNTVTGYSYFTAAYGGYANAGTPPIEVYGAIDHFNIDAYPQQPPQGTGCRINFGVSDASGFSVYSANSVYNITSDDTGALINGGPLPRTVDLTDGGGSFYIDFSSMGTHTITLADTGLPALPGGSMTITATAPYHLLTAASPQAPAAGAECDVDFWMADTGGNTVVTVYDTFMADSDDPAAVINGQPLPQSVYLSAGAGNFPIVFSSPGIHEVYLNDFLPYILPGGSVTITVTAP